MMLGLITAIALFTCPPSSPVPCDAPLPWEMPGLPYVPSVSIEALTLSEPPAGTAYAEQESTVVTMLEGWADSLGAVNGMFEEWIGTSGTMPDATGGDFDTGLAPLQDVGTAYEVAEWLGVAIATLFNYMRAATELPGTVVGTMIAALLICASLLLLVKMFQFAVQAFDLVWSLTNTIIVTIMEIIPG